MVREPTARSTISRAIESCVAMFSATRHAEQSRAHQKHTTSDTQRQSHKSEAVRDSQATQIVRLVLELGAELFPDEECKPYIVLPIKEHHEVHSLRSRHVRTWLAGQYFTHTGKAAGGQALADAQNVLEAHALAAASRSVFVRIARQGDKVFLI